MTRRASRLAGQHVRRIGFMQGRFSPEINGKIQAFPWPYWEEEFQLAAQHGFGIMEWTLDHERLFENPLMTEKGKKAIKTLSDRFGLRVPSVTGDFFMQAPFFKVTGERQKQFFGELVHVIEACAELNISTLVIPLVDASRVESDEQSNVLISQMNSLDGLLSKSGVRVLFESDLSPIDLAKFIGHFPADTYGINYDIGNSASLGFSSATEISSYGNSIGNVHVKDRLLAGTTVPLGEGAADLPGTLSLLEKSGYTGNYILQTARSPNGAHGEVLCKYRDFVARCLGS
jgi:hexulose-6-phosphate isomerase